jgi:hypothetical protein
MMPNALTLPSPLNLLLSTLNSQLLRHPLRDVDMIGKISRSRAENLNL